ncbi:Zn(2)-C6 fungal-type domain-containing protein [Mycena chlorophos]|uniref:Zn(2)-C6 fungal-type domain-containing protein n=1 Tax=Mycena chlorophos TaxID=658473 RepID=A0A8H6SBS0_MYCCL|nr:Zn(2)-C6 fungal-type domain-containing protein [Mycena chlorophos]
MSLLGYRYSPPSVPHEPKDEYLPPLWDGPMSDETDMVGLPNISGHYIVDSSTLKSKRTKPRRTNRACLKCRKAKVRCIRHTNTGIGTGSPTTALRLAETQCERCTRRGEACEYGDGDGKDGSDGGMDLAHAALMDSATRIRPYPSSSRYYDRGSLSSGPVRLPVPWADTRQGEAYGDGDHDYEQPTMDIRTSPALSSFSDTSSAASALGPGAYSLSESDAAPIAIRLRTPHSSRRPHTLPPVRNPDYEYYAPVPHSPRPFGVAHWNDLEVVAAQDRVAHSYS